MESNCAIVKHSLESRVRDLQNFIYIFAYSTRRRATRAKVDFLVGCALAIELGSSLKVTSCGVNNRAPNSFATTRKDGWGDNKLNGNKAKHGEKCDLNQPQHTLCQKFPFPHNFRLGNFRLPRKLFAFFAFPEDIIQLVCFVFMYTVSLFILCGTTFDPNWHKDETRTLWHSKCAFSPPKSLVLCFPTKNSRAWDENFLRIGTFHFPHQQHNDLMSLE